MSGVVSDLLESLTEIWDRVLEKLGGAYYKATPASVEDDINKN